MTLPNTPHHRESPFTAEELWEFRKRLSQVTSIAADLSGIRVDYSTRAPQLPYDDPTFQLLCRESIGTNVLIGMVADGMREEFRANRCLRINPHFIRRVGLLAPWLKGAEFDSIVYRIASDAYWLLSDEFNPPPPTYVKPAEVPDEVVQSPTLSHIKELKRVDNKSGIIFDTLSDLIEAIRLMRSRPGYRGVASYFSEEMIRDMEAKINGGYDEWKSYTKFYMRNKADEFYRFFNVQKRDGQFILRLKDSSQYEDEEATIATRAKAPQGLDSVNCDYELHKIGNTDWAGIDLDKILAHCTNDSDREHLAKVLSGEIENDFRRYEINIDGGRAKLFIRFNQRPIDTNGILRMGNKLFLHCREGNGFGPPRFGFTLEPLDREPAVTTSAKNNLQSLANELHDSVIRSLGPPPHSSD